MDFLCPLSEVFWGRTAIELLLRELAKVGADSRSPFLMEPWSLGPGCGMNHLDGRSNSPSPVVFPRKVLTALLLSIPIYYYIERLTTVLFYDVMDE